MPLVLKLDKHNLKILFNNFIRLKLDKHNLKILLNNFIRLKLDKHNLKILINNFIRSSLILSIINNANSLISFFFQ